jgi:cysteine desulfurase
MKKIYLDYNATTPVAGEVFDEMLPFLKEHYGNPSSIHWAGRIVKGYVDTARERAAKLIGAKPSEIIFTSCGSESNNLAIKGAFLRNLDKGKHIITSRVEHPCVLETCRYLEKNGADVTYLDVDGGGLLDPEDVKKAIRKDTVLITLMHANNETGVMFPIKEIGALAKEKEVLFHTDAAQTVGKIPVDVDDLNVDMLTVAGHKIYAPKGVGFLYVRKGTRLVNLIHGGHQERGKRAGTENTPYIIGLGKACEISGQHIKLYEGKIRKLRDRLEREILAKVPDSRLNGSRKHRVPSTTNLSFMFIEGEAILLGLDMYGIAASSGSACSSGSLDPSHVLLAMGFTHEQAHGSVRLSLGIGNSEEDTDKVIEVMPEIVERLRKISPLYREKRKAV